MDWPASAPERRLRLRRLRGCRLSGVIKLQNLGCCSPSMPDADDRAEKSISKRPAGCLKSSHGGAGVVSDFFFANASAGRQAPSNLLCVVPQFHSSQSYLIHM